MTDLFAGEDERVPFSVLAARAPHHDPTTCTREPCGRCRPKAKPRVPKPVDHQPRQPTDPPDPTIRTVGLPAHPDPVGIAEVLDKTASLLRKQGRDAQLMAGLLAARGYPASTLGDGRGGGTSSSTERHATNPAPWDDADLNLATLLRLVWLAAGELTRLVGWVMSHASDVDPLPAGTGACRACNRVCRPTAARPQNRLRSGLCPTCSRAWQRYRAGGGNLSWADWVARRRESYTERDAAGRVVAIHTPEPDHDIDLTG